MLKQNGSGLFLETLLDEGVKCIFGNPGTTELPLMDALVNENRLDYILCLHESVAIGAAEGYAFATGGVGVVNIHVAPGLGNAMGMLYNSKRAGTPLLVTAGNQGQEGQLSEPILWDDLPRLATPFTKWSHEIRRVEDLEQCIRRAIKVALTPPTGPVFLSLPGDVMLSEAVELTGSPTRLSNRICAGEDVIESAVRLLLQAKKPCIVAGSRVFRSSACNELVEVSERIGALVYGDNKPNTAFFPASHKLYCGELPNTIVPLLDELESSDVVFFIGTEAYTLSYPPSIPLKPRGAQVIYLDSDPWEIGKNFPVEVAMLGDPKTTLSRMLEVIEKLAQDSDEKFIEERRFKAEKIALEKKQKITPKIELSEDRGMSRSSFIATIGESIPEGTAIVDESLTTGWAGMRQAIAKKAGHYFGTKGGGIGLGLPTTLGVKKALPDTPVICISGDGSSMYTFQTLWTASHYGLNAVWIIANNGSYRILKERAVNLGRKTNEFRKFVAMDLQNPSIDFQNLAKSLGVSSTRAETPKELKKAINEALQSGKPYLIDALIINDEL
ncbi:MAG: thiamine pyrophosphate-binding protein [Nitrospinota bacterium]|nr:thiamine pyrophosphate-binding protein [Nitrospinota bacterium]